MNLIDKLKNNDAHRIFADLPKAESQMMWKVGSGNCEYLTDDMHWMPVHRTDKFFNIGVYRINPDYRPEPEYDNLPVEADRYKLFVRVRGIPITMHKLPALPDFRGFYSNDEAGERGVNIEGVAYLVNQKRTVIARFERQTNEEAEKGSAESDRQAEQL